MLLPLMFISLYTTIYFFVKKLTFSNIYISVNTIFEYLYMFSSWERGHQLSMYATVGGMVGSSKMHTAAYRGRVCYASCVPKHLHYLLPCFLQYFYLILSCLICRNLTLPLFKKDVFVRNSYFPLNEISFCRHEINFFQLKLILRTKVRQKAIDFNQIESQVYSIF